MDPPHQHQQHQLVPPLSEELWMQIMVFVPPLDMLGSACLVSNQWKNWITNDNFWKNHPLLLLLVQRQQIDLGDWNVHQMQRYGLYETWKKSQEARNVTHGAQTQRQLARLVQTQALLPSHEQAEELSKYYPQRTCCTSSTNVMRRTPRWLLASPLVTFDEDVKHKLWHSAPNTDRDSTEMLMFTTSAPLSVISYLEIKPWLDDGEVYTWKRTIVRAYLATEPALDSMEQVRRRPVPTALPFAIRSFFSPIFYNGKCYRDQITIDAAVHGLTPVYESEVIPMRDEPGLVRIDFPHSVVANLITIELVGKNRLSDQDEVFTNPGYMVGVEQVDVWGLPLLQEPHFEEARVEQLPNPLFSTPLLRFPPQPEL